MEKFNFNITQYDFEPESYDEFIKVKDRYKSGELHTYYTAYHNISDLWIITHHNDLGPACINYKEMNEDDKFKMINSTIIYFGFITDKEFGKQLMENIIIND